MFQRQNSRVADLLGLVAEARERASKATLAEDNKFRLDIESKWLSLVQTTQHVERTKEFLTGQDTE
jgi:hypothetical protein